MLLPTLAASFASSKLTGRTVRATVLRLVVTRGATVVVRVKRGTRTVATRKVVYKTGGRKEIALPKLAAATYGVTLTATDGAASAVDRAALRIIPGR